ncbi:MAG: right-handed parallel beta-helix repeat-containing protein [Pseudomonadota bacterium]
MQPFSPRAARTLLIALASLFALSAQGATYLVSHSGTDSPTCGTKNDHCRTINQANALAGNNDTVLVYPGSYREALTINNNGLQLLSTNGRWATRIIAPFGVADAITVISDNVRIGNPRQGFAVRVSDGFFADSVRMINGADNAKVEGNYFYGNGNGVNGDGSDRLQVRHNLIDVTDYAVRCESCTDPLISDNDIDGGNSASDVVRVVGSDIVYQRNLIRDAGNVGAMLFGSSLVQDNAVYSSSSDPFWATFPDGSGGKFEGNIAGFGFGAWGVNTTGDKLLVKNNVAVGGAGEIGFLGDARRYLNNTAVGHLYGFQVDGGVIQKFSKNSGYGGTEVWGSAMSIDNTAGGTTINALSHFRDVDGISAGVTGSFTNSPQAVNTSKAAALQ